MSDTDYKQRLTNNYFIEYQQGTAKRLNKLEVEADILHYILGLGTSFYKIKQLYTFKKMDHRKAYIEEVGQFYWYLAGLCYSLRMVFNPYVPSPTTVPRPFFDWARIEDRVYTILDYYRQYLAEGKEFASAETEILINEILEYLVNIAFALEIPVEAFLFAIVDKLGAPNEDIVNEVKIELKGIKRIIARYKKNGRPTKFEKRETELVTLGETWNDKEQYASNRKRKPGVRANKWQWKRLRKLYKEQRKTRIKDRSWQNLFRSERKKSKTNK